MRIAIIVAYFGRFPNYYQLFLDSCKANPHYDWLIFSDDETHYRYPNNVHLVKMSFSECQKLVQSKFDFTVSLSNPQKLCDYKCAYGVIFEDYLQAYQWWGHCDLDQIFGDLDSFLTEQMLREYDKLFSLGHLTLYRNLPDNNRVFMGTLNGKQRYREVFSTDRGCGFDEWLPGNVNELYLQSNRPVYYDNLGADLNPYQTTFETVHFDLKTRRYRISDIHNSIFYREKGHIYQLYATREGLQKKEYPYVHLQKRRMKDARRNQDDGDYYLIPNRFVEASSSPRMRLSGAWIFRLLNIQFFKVKMNSLKYRIKNSDWTFTRIFE